MLKTYSRVLGEDIICVEDDEKVEPIEGLVTYTRTELMGLRGLAPETLRAIHSTKKSLGGTYLGPAPPR